MESGSEKEPSLHKEEQPEGQQYDKQAEEQKQNDHEQEIEEEKREDKEEPKQKEDEQEIGQEDKEEKELQSDENSPAVARPTCAADPEPLRNLIVNYLPPQIDEGQLCNLFGQFGPIDSVKIIYDKETRESRGYGFVKYTHFFSATYAINALNGYQIAWKRLKVAYADVDAAMESYKTLRTSAMMFSMQQQMALQSVFYQQIMLARSPNRDEPHQ